MAKKDSKKTGKKDQAAAGAAEAVEAVRSAVERTFAASAEGAKSTRGRAMDVTAAANRIREVLEDRVLKELKGLRSDLEGLAKRVSALEVGPLGGSSATRRPAAKQPSARRAASKRASSAAKRSSSSAAAKPASKTRKSASSAKPASSTARKSASSTARKSASSRAKKPAASRSSTARKPATRRTGSTGSGGGTSGS